jgi:hypothetical protein
MNGLVLEYSGTLSDYVNIFRTNLNWFVLFMLYF